jgi:hypothetical protein
MLYGIYMHFSQIFPKAAGRNRQTARRARSEHYYIDYPEEIKTNGICERRFPFLSFSGFA